MPQRLSKIFDVAVTPIEERYSKLVACNYDGDKLDQAERYRICSNSEYVESEELLIRLMERPSHVQKDVMEFTGNAFLEARKRGISVQQSSLTTPEFSHSFGKEKALKANREYLGFVEGLCKLFRDAASPINGRRLFAVFHTPEGDNHAHVDIFVVISPSKGEKAAIQQVFYDAFNLARLQCPP